MANGALDVTRERLRQERAARAARVRELVRPPVSAEDRLGCCLKVGARVVDLVTGEEGYVIAGTIEDVIIPDSRRREG